MKKDKDNELQNLLTELVQRIEGIQRWKRYPHKFQQNVLEHTMETVLLTKMVIAIEREVDTQFDAYLLLSAAADHDLGEGIIGDIAYDIKNDVRVKDALEIIEKEQFQLMFSKLDFGPYSDAVVRMFTRSFEVQEEQISVEGQLFNAIEKLGYVIFALREIDEKNEIFVKVLVNHHESLIAYSKKYTSIGLIYEKCLEHMRHLGTFMLLEHNFKVEWLKDKTSNEEAL